MSKNKIEKIELLKKILNTHEHELFFQTIKNYSKELEEREIIILETLLKNSLFEEINYFLDKLIENESKINKQNEIKKNHKTKSELLIPVFKNGKWGLVNIYKEVIVDFLYDYIEPFENEMTFAIRDKNTYIFNHSGKITSELKGINILGKFYEEKAIIYNNNNMPKKYGVINRLGEIIIEPKFGELNRFSENLCKANNTENDCIGFINEKGELAIDFKFKKYSDHQHELIGIGWHKTGEVFNEGLCKVASILNNESGIISNTGETIIPFGKWNTLNTFSEGVSSVGKKYYDKKTSLSKSKFGFIDKIGNEIMEIKYDLTSSFFEGLAVAVINNKYGFINKYGETEIPFVYDFAMPFCNGIAAVFLNVGNGNKSPNRKWGYINKYGETVIPHVYDGNFTLYDLIPYASSISNNLICVKKNDKYGYITKDNELVIEHKYTIAHDFRNGVAMVSDEEEWYRKPKFYIDTNGTEYKMYS